jgi:hypothetical protein
MHRMTRRQVLQLGAGVGAVLILPEGCRSLLAQLDQLASTLTPTPPGEIDLPTASPTATVEANPLDPRPPVGAQASPLESPLAPTPEPAPTATSIPQRKLEPPGGGSKLGLHVTFGPRAGLDEFLARCAQSGHPVALVKCVDDFEAAFKAKQSSDKTYTVGRVNAVGLSNKNFIDMQAWEPPDFNPPVGFHYTTAQEAAQQYYDLVKPIWQLNPVIDAWETFNEFSWHWGWQADFYIQLMDLAEADGYRLGLWSCSAGNPPEESYPDIVRACQRAQAHGDHILCLHEYGLDGLLKKAPHSLVTRYRQLYKVLKQNEAVIPLVISEAGENAGGGFTGIETFLDDFAWYDRQLSRDDYVIGCAAWTLGNFSGANFQAALPALADYITGGYVVGSSTRFKNYLPLIEHDAVK